MRAVVFFIIIDLDLESLPVIEILKEKNKKKTLCSCSSLGVLDSHEFISQINSTMARRCHRQLTVNAGDPVELGRDDSFKRQFVR